jgi:diguanylate cyclase (GGDEF)-like protein
MPLFENQTTKLKRFLFGPVKKVNEVNFGNCMDDYLELLPLINENEINSDKSAELFNENLLRFINNTKPAFVKSCSILYKEGSADQFYQYPSGEKFPIKLKRKELESIEQAEYIFYISNASFESHIDKDMAGIAFRFFERYIYVVYGDINKRSFMRYLKRLELAVIELKKKEKNSIVLYDYKKKIVRLESELQLNKKSLIESRKQLKRRVYGLRNLLEMSRELHYLQGVEKVISSSLLILLGQFSFQRSFALLYDSETMKYSRLFFKGFTLNKKESFEIDIDGAMIKYLSANIAPSRISDIYEKSRFKKKLKVLKKWRIDYIMPIVLDNRVKGVIGFGEKMIGSALDRDELDMIGVLVDSVSISLANAQMYEDIKKMSMTDAMTNLNNYRYFEDRLKEEINRARRKKTCVSMLMLDIDYFKNYNDSLGHQAGDEALRLIGSVLKLTARDDDIVTRYGGEEFCVILPGVEKEVIRNLAERVRENIEAFNFYKEEVQPGGKLTVSIGGATFPDDADSFEELVNRADSALYKSKHDGRNRFTLYDTSIDNVAKD